MASNTPSPPESDPSIGLPDIPAPACVMVFNASDPSGAGGLTADIATISSVGGHPVAIVTGAYVRDTRDIFDHYCLDDEAVREQARAALEDLSIQVIKVGFAGSPGALAAIAELTSDYADIPVISYMPNLAWWEEALIEPYLDAFRELLLPQTSVLVGNFSSLWRWLLPDWDGPQNPTARDLAAAAAEMGTPYTLVTGIPLPDQHIDNVLASPHTILGSSRFELFDATFTGAGDTLSAALAALIACGTDLNEACTEALSYLDRCLDGGFRPGMGHVVPDRMFWAEPEDDDAADAPSGADLDLPSIDGFAFPPHDTKH